MLTECLLAVARRFRAAHSGLAAVEFALLLPVMITFVFGGYETVRGVTEARRLTTLANAISQQMSAATVIKGQTYAELTKSDLVFLTNTAMVTFPQVLRDNAQLNNGWMQNIAITLSSVQFRPTTNGCVSNCTYVANVIWTSGSQKRSCTTQLQPQPNTSAPAPGYLPIDLYGPGTIIVVDVAYSFRPLVGGTYFGNGFVLRRSAYVQPRYAQTIYYQNMTGDSFVSPCPLNAH